jgi:hypothetical protein
MTKVLAILVLLALPLRLAAQEKTVIVAEGNQLPAVKVGDVVRITQSAAAGRTQFTVSVAGPAKLVSTTNIRKFVDGRPLIGAMTKEFEIKAEMKGKATIKIETKDLVDKKTEVKEYTLIIE